MTRRLLLSLLLIIVSGCSKYNLSTSSEAMAKLSEAQLFTRGEDALVKGDYYMAVRYLEGLDSQYPFGKYSEQALLDLIYAYYKKGDNVATVATATRYINLYPRSEHIDYAYYMKGVADFEQDRGFLMEYFPIDVALRDPGTTRQSFNDFAILLRRFPNSIYVADARQRMVYLRNLFAQYELNNAQYYFDRQAYVAASNRASYLIENYAEAPQTEDALVLLVESKRRLGLNQGADEALAVLSATYPHSPEIAKLRGKTS